MQRENHLTLLENYRSAVATASRQRALKSLLEVHRPVLSALSQRFARIHSHVWDREDAAQQAVVGAMRAYDTFEPGRGSCLSTWVYQEVLAELQRSVCASAPIRVPQRRALLVSLLQGRLDGRPLLKNVASSRYGLGSEGSLNSARSECALLVNRADTMNYETAARGELDDIPLRIDIARALSELPSRQRLALKAIAFDGLDSDAAAAKLRISRGQLKSLLYAGRKALKLALKG